MAKFGRWEWSKENADPATNEIHLKKEQGIDHQSKHNYESLIASEKDYPLQHWIDYLKWSENNHEPEAQFLLMERCVRKCMHQCKDDVRFIQICVRYADKTSFPPDVFKYLYQHKVGIKVALFWIAWAWVAETRGDFAFCEKLYKKGILKEAAPLALLHQRHKQFQRRMSRQRENSLTLERELQNTRKDSENKREELKQHNRAASSSKASSRQTRNDDLEVEGRGESQRLRKRVLQCSEEIVLPGPTMPQRLTENESKVKTTALIKCGFEKELVAKDADGQEVCFEEHRARGRYFNLFPNHNINHLTMEESLEEVDMEIDESTSVSKESIPARRVLFSTSSSFEGHDYRSIMLNTSTTSSTTSRFVGVSASREEETINTKFAMKELSMMFSSPAMGVGVGRNSDQLKRPRLNDSQSFDGPLMEEDDEDQVNNSIVNMDPQASERKHFQIFLEADTNSGTRTSDGDDVRQKGFSIYTEGARDTLSLEEGARHLSKLNDDRRETAIMGDFQIFVEENEDVAQQGVQRQKIEDNNSFHLKRKGLQIFNDENETTGVNSSIAAIERKCFAIFSDKNEVTDADNDETGSRPKNCRKNVLKDVSILHEDAELDADSVTDGDGDTATLSLFDDAVCALKDAIQLNDGDRCSPHSAVKHYNERKSSPMSDNYGDDDSESSPNAVEGGDTATFSVFGDAVGALAEMTIAKPSRPSDLSPLGNDEAVHNLSVSEPVLCQ